MLHVLLFDSPESHKSEFLSKTYYWCIMLRSEPLAFLARESQIHERSSKWIDESSLVVF